MVISSLSQPMVSLDLIERRDHVPVHVDEGDGGRKKQGGQSHASRHIHDSHGRHERGHGYVTLALSPR